VTPASARRSARKSAIGASSPNDNGDAASAEARPNISPSPAKGFKPHPKRDERIPWVKKVDKHAETEDEGSASSSDSDAGEPVSRQAFLENEKAKRQREARNFVYSGDADAPKQTRSGRVLTSTSVSVVPEDAPGTASPAVAVEAPDTPSKIAAHISAGATRTPSRRAFVDSTAVTPSLLDLPTPTKPTPAPAPAINGGQTVNGNGPGARGKRLGGKVRQLPEGARPYLEQTMAILTGARDQAEDGPMPLDAEDENETLKGLVNVLRGTVCRGEGNSALLVGPRGSGKTRVRIHHRRCRSPGPAHLSSE
jgi:origin recognition complex subunit 4